MAKLENYNGSVSLMAGITQKGGGDFAMVEANAVQTREDGTRLDAELLSLQSLVGGKADAEHSHDNLYYTKAEVDGKIDKKADISSVPTTLADLSGDETHRTVTDAEKASWNEKSDFSGSYNDLTDKPTIPSIDGLASTDYVDEQISSANTYTDDKIALLLNNSSEAVDSIMELAAAMDENEDVVDALEQAIGTKVDKVDGMGLSHNDFTDEDKEKLNSPVPTTNVVHGEAQELLSNIIETYILNVNYSLLAFDTDEIVFSTSPGDDSGSGGSGSEDPDDTTSATTAVLGYAVLGQMVLG